MWRDVQRSAHRLSSHCSQLTSGLLSLLGPELPAPCLAALEQAVVRTREEGCDAPATSWKDLAGAYERAGLRPSAVGLSRALYMMQ